MLIFAHCTGQKTHFPVYHKCSVTQKMTKMRFRPALCPGPCWGVHDAPPDLLVGWGENTTPQTSPLTPLSAFGLRRSPLVPPAGWGLATDLQKIVYISRKLSGSGRPMLFQTTLPLSISLFSPPLVFFGDELLNCVEHYVLLLRCPAMCRASDWQRAFSHVTITYCCFLQNIQKCLT